MANSTETSEQDNDELRKRRERLEALKSKRSGAPAPATPAAAPDAPGGPEGGPAMGVFGGGGPKRGRQRKMLMKIYKVLTQTPADTSGMVPDTPFTETGVARLMDMLQTRSSDPSLAGAKVAEGLLNFIRPSEGEGATTSGASVEKLQLLARRIEHMRGNTGGAGRKGAW